MHPEAIERKERPPGRPGPHCGRAPKVLSKLTERAGPEKPLVDIPQDHSKAARIPHNRLSETLYLDAPLPWSQSEMGCDHPDRTTLSCDIDVKGTARLTRWDVQVNAPHRQDRQAREECNPVVPTRSDKGRAGHDLEA